MSSNDNQKAKTTVLKKDVEFQVKNTFIIVHYEYITEKHPFKNA